MMQIGLLYSALRGFNTLDGGIASHFAELAAGLAATGARVRVYVVAEETPPSIYRTSDDYEIIALPAPLPRWLHRATGRPWQLHSLTGAWFRARAAARLVLADHAARPLDVLETSSSGLLASNLSRAHRCPPLVTRVSTTSEQLVTHNSGPATRLSRLVNSLERRLVIRSDVIVTHTRHHREAFCAAWHLDPARVALVPHGIALPPADALPPRPAPAAPLNLLYVGRFEHRKGIDTLLAALPAVLARHPRAHAILAGHDADDYWQNKFWSDNPLLSRERVRFPGRVDALTLADLYRQATVFVAPSRYESFGLIYVEAMSWAKPVIACAVGGVPEVVLAGVSGLLHHPGDIDGLTGHLETLLSDARLREQYGRAGRTRAERFFSREAMSAASLSLYREAISRGRNR